MTMTAAALAFVAAFTTAASAQNLPIRYQPEPDFETILHTAVAPMKGKDAFAGLAECSVLDAKTFAPVTVAQAHQMIAPCVKGVGQRYGAELTLERLAASAEGEVSVQVEGLAIYVPAAVAVTSPLMRDLQRGLDARQGRVLGHPVTIRRGPAPSADKPAKASLEKTGLVQAALDRCLQPMVLRRIDSSEDFILYYGRCLADAKELKIREMRPAAGRAMGITLLSLAEEPVVRGLNGPVSVVAANGPVTLTVVAYAQTTYLP